MLFSIPPPPTFVFRDQPLPYHDSLQPFRAENHKTTIILCPPLSRSACTSAVCVCVYMVDG